MRPLPDLQVPDSLSAILAQLAPLLAQEALTGVPAQVDISNLLDQAKELKAQRLHAVVGQLRAMELDDVLTVARRAGGSGQEAVHRAASAEWLRRSKGVEPGGSVTCLTKQDVHTLQDLGLLSLTWEAGAALHDFRVRVLGTEHRSEWRKPRTTHCEVPPDHIWGCRQPAPLAETTVD